MNDLIWRNTIRNMWHERKMVLKDDHWLADQSGWRFIRQEVAAFFLILPFLLVPINRDILHEFLFSNLEYAKILDPNLISKASQFSYALFEVYKITLVGNKVQVGNYLVQVAKIQFRKIQFQKSHQRFRESWILKSGAWRTRAPSRWSFHLNSAWSRIETTTIEKTHFTL